MKNPLLVALVALLLSSCSNSGTSESNVNDELNAAKERKFLDTHFSRYGPEKNRAIVAEQTGFRLRLPASANGVAQTGVNSVFALAGDFEVSAAYEFLAVTPPATGYGVTCGIAIDTEGPAGNVQLMRGFQKGNVNGYIISLGKPAVKVGHFLDTHFSRYGPETDKAITREDSGFHFQLPDMPNGVGQTGVSSKFQLMGDFEVSATYDLVAVSPPTAGYGVTCGIAVESNEPAGDVYLTRGYRDKKANGYVVTTAKPKSGGGINYDNKDYPSKARKGKLVLRREKKELVCLVADDPDDENLRELRRIPYTDGNIKQVRFYADNGGSEGVMDVRVGNVKIQTENTIDDKAMTGGMNYNDIKHEPAKTQKGRLVLRREKNDLICLVADKTDASAESLEEIHRFPFTQATVKKVRVFADTGGSPDALDARISDIVIQAKEITGAMAKADRPTKWAWWVIPGIIVLLGAGVIGFLMYRRRRGAADEE